ncbi:IS110 family transposase [Cupriavidus necator]|uniref:IS110 family transposase n=1 Tax=Cupriavidus necator TaxID=106590 RepID=UPI0006922D98
MKLTAIGMDIVKHIFQLHAVNANSGEIERKLKRGQVTEFFTKRERALVAMEACGSAHHWARQLQPLSATK